MQRSVTHLFNLALTSNPQFSTAVEEFVSLTAGTEYTTQLAHKVAIDQVLLRKKLPTPVVCLTHCEGDEERVEQTLRKSARERQVEFHLVELADATDRERARTELNTWSSSDGGWVLITFSHLLDEPQITWKLLAEVGSVCLTFSMMLCYYYFSGCGE